MAMIESVARASIFCDCAAHKIFMTARVRPAGGGRLIRREHRMRLRKKAERRAMAEANGQALVERRDKPWIFRTYAGHSTARKSNRLYRRISQKARQDCRSLSICPPKPDSQRPPAGVRRGRKGRRRDFAHRRHADIVRGHSARLDEHFDDHQRHSRVANGALYRDGRRAGRSPQSAPRHDPERHHQGIFGARLLRVSAGCVAAPH